MESGIFSSRDYSFAAHPETTPSMLARIAKMFILKVRDQDILGVGDFMREEHISRRDIRSQKLRAIHYDGRNNPP